MKDGDTLALLLRRVRRFDVLTPAQERALARRSAAGDEGAREAILHHNLRLVISVAKRFRGLGVPFLDLIQEGYLGLSRAVDRFDHTLGYKFSTYATWWIRQACQQAVADQRSITVPTYVRSRQLVLHRARVELAARLGREPTTTELAEATSMTPSHAREALTADLVPASIDFDSEGRSVVAGLVDESLDDPVDLVERDRASQAAREVLGTLMPLERSILEMRFGLADGVEHTFKEVAAELGMDSRRVAFIEREALERLTPRLSYALGISRDDPR